MPITLTFTLAGSFTIEDDGIVGNGTSVVRRDSDGAILAIIPHPADSLTFRATTPGVNLTFNVTDSFGTGTLTVGSLTNAAETPDSIVVRNIESSSSVTLVSNGSITEGGSDLAADISASSIILSAVSGVGTPGSAIETQTTAMEAETTTGGINIGNVGDLQVGGFSADVDGLDVGTSGDIVLTNLGSITLSDETSFDSVHGGDSAGDVTLVAHGYDSDITSNVDQSSIIAPRGSVFLTAGRDVSFGLGGVEFGNDVRANGSIVVNAGRDFLLSGFADFFADGVLGTSGGNLIVNAGRNISLLDDTGNSASLAVLGSGGGDVILTTGQNGRVTLEPPSTNTLSSGSGSIVVNADRIVIGASSGITAPVDVTLRPVSEGRAILLGSLSDSGAAIELSDGELDRIFSDTLILGSNSTGRITVGAPIAPGSVQNFTLRSGTDIFANSSLTAADALSLFAGDNVHQLAASTITASTLAVFVDQAGDDGGVGGLNTFAGTVTSVATAIVGNGEADILNGTDGADTINGFGGNDTINGGGGTDTMNGGTGNDSMSGGLGDDFYFVDSFSDVIVEAVGEGSDRIFASSSYAIGAGVHVEILSTTNNAGTAAINLTGNELVNSIAGNNGNNILNGGVGADTLNGLGGDDFFFVDNIGDVVVEAVGGGSDRIFASVSYTLANGVHVETLSTTNNAGLDAIDLTGNALVNSIAGNNGNNVLNGAGGADTLNGLGGNDFFYVDQFGDVVVEAAGGGTDRIFASSSYAMGAGVHVEILSTTNNAGVNAINFAGNELVNSIAGNNGANVLDGGGGSDTLNGLGGADTFRFTTALGAGNVDTIAGYAVADDVIQIDDAVFTGLAAGALAAGAFNTGAGATQADDRIIYNAATGALLFDADGVGGVAGIQFATLSPGLAMTASEFFVI